LCILLTEHKTQLTSGQTQGDHPVTTYVDVIWTELAHGVTRQSDSDDVQYSVI